MKIATILICAAASTAAVCAAEEQAVTQVLESVGLFKNGLAVVRASFPVAGPGRYRWEQVPRVVHGSFWIESDGKVAVQTTTRVIEVTDATESPNGSAQKDLAGKEVTVRLKSATGDGIGREVKGKVWDAPPRAATKAWDAEYSSLNPSAGSYYWYRSSSPLGAPAAAAPAGTGNFLVLEGPLGRCYIDPSSIAAIECAGPFGPVVRREERPVLVFDVQQAPTGGGAVRVTYLTKGLAWLPSYQVDLTDPAKLRLRQSAVVRNEMADLANTEIQLISGFPNVRFGNVDSPMWPGTGLAAFFQQVNQSGSSPLGLLSSNSLAGQQVMFNNFSTAGGRADSAALPELAEQGNLSDDIHYESIGKRDLKAGDTLALDVASAEAAYERVVEWVVADPRDGSGRYQRSNGGDPTRDDQPWDAVRFANPLPFPMTTGSALVTEAGKFRGESMSQWVNPGQRTSLRITRALSVRTEASEVEEEGQREIVWIGGNDYQRTKVKGRLAVQNFRGKEVTVTVRCEFSGECLEADADPQKSLRTEGVYSVNPRRQLEWTLKLPAGKEQVLNYRHSVLVDR